MNVHDQDEAEHRGKEIGIYLAVWLAVAALMACAWWGGPATGQIQGPVGSGNWSPTLFGSTGAGSPTYVAPPVGSYEIVGRLVVARFSIAASALGSPSGNMQVGGLPVTASGETGACSITAIEGVALTANFTWMAAQVTANTTNILLVENGSSQTVQAIPVANFTPTVIVQGICFYRFQ